MKYLVNEVPTKSKWDMYYLVRNDVGSCEEMLGTAERIGLKTFRIGSVRVYTKTFRKILEKYKKGYKNYLT